MGLAARARNLVCTPRDEWQRIAVERLGIGRLYTDYVAILAAIPLVVELIRALPIRPPLGEVIETILSSYVMALIGVAVLAIVSNMLAPRFGGFGGVDDLPQSFKLAGFGLTPAWLGSVFLLLPWIGSFLALVGTLYSIYVYYLGVTELLCVPPRRRGGYAVVAIAATIVVAALVELVVALLTGHLQVIGVHPHGTPAPAPQPPSAKPG